MLESVPDHIDVTVLSIETDPIDPPLIPAAFSYYLSCLTNISVFVSNPISLALFIKRIFISSSIFGVLASSHKYELLYPDTNAY